MASSRPLRPPQLLPLLLASSGPLPPPSQAPPSPTASPLLSPLAGAPPRLPPPSPAPGAPAPSPRPRALPHQFLGPGSLPLPAFPRLSPPPFILPGPAHGHAGRPLYPRSFPGHPLSPLLHPLLPIPQPVSVPAACQLFLAAERLIHAAPAECARSLPRGLRGRGRSWSWGLGAAARSGSWAGFAFIPLATPLSACLWLRVSQGQPRGSGCAPQVWRCDVEFSGSEAGVFAWARWDGRCWVPGGGGGFEAPPGIGEGLASQWLGAHSPTALGTPLPTHTLFFSPPTPQPVPAPPKSAVPSTASHLHGNGAGAGPGVGGRDQTRHSGFRCWGGWGWGSSRGRQTPLGTHPYKATSEDNNGDLEHHSHFGPPDFHPTSWPPSQPPSLPQNGASSAWQCLATQP